MIRTLGRKAWLRHRSTPNTLSSLSSSTNLLYTHGYSRSLSNRSVLTVGTVAWRTGATSSRSTSRRDLSTPRPPIDPITETEHLTPSTSTAGRKSKVDLRPAPRKAAEPVQPANAPVEPTIPEVVPAPSTTVTPQPPPQASVGSKLGVVKTALADLEDAVRRGILKPPPITATPGSMKFLFYQMWELMKFYAIGLKKLVVEHRREVAAIRKQAKAEGRELTRRELRTVQTYKKDLARLVPFAMVVLIIEELLPLIILYAPFLLPSTCKLPAQAERILRIADENRARALQDGHALLQDQSLKATTPTASTLGSTMSLSALNGPLTKVVARAFSFSTFGPLPFLRYRIQKHLRYLAEDDALLVRETYGANLTELELREALGERGFSTASLSVAELGPRLHRWLIETKGGGDERLTALLRHMGSEHVARLKATTAL